MAKNSKEWIVNVKYTNTEATPEVREYIDSKLDALSKLVVVHKEDEAVQCDIELEKALEQQHGDIWRAEMNLHIGSEMYRATARGESMNAALDEMKDEISKCIRRSKKKKFDLLRRGGAKLKEWTRFGK